LGRVSKKAGGAGRREISGWGAMLGGRKAVPPRRPKGGIKSRGR